MPSWLVLIALLAGCDQLFELDEVPLLTDGRVGDGTETCQPPCDGNSAPPPPRLLISEISLGGLDATCSYDPTDEFIEIYNPESVDASAGGIRVECSQLTSALFTTCGSLPHGLIIRAHGYYMVANAGTTGDSCGFANATPDEIITGALNEDGGAARLVGSNDTIIDAVAWGPSPGGEGNALGPWPPANWSPYFNSIERKAMATSTADSMTTGADKLAGNGYDSNNNQADFVYRGGRNPQNTGSAAEP